MLFSLQTMTQPIKVYTDGAASGNPGPGGYGVILTYGGHRKELSAGFRRTTNNRMELLAVVEALRAIKKPGAEVIVHSDSQYVVNSVEKGWVFGWEKKGFKGKKNPDLWEQYLEVAKNFKVKFIWLRGHAGHAENERCDELAVAAARSPEFVDEGYENGDADG